MIISVVIPTLNEETGVGATLEKLPRDLLHQMGWQMEVIIVDGNSKDKTIEIANKLGARVIIEPRKGYGRAYKTGFECCQGEVIVTLDADATYPAEKIPEYLQYFLDNNLDFLTINRFGDMEKGAMTFEHKFGNAVLSFTLRTLFRVAIRDSQSGMWIMKRDSIMRLKPQSDGMPFSEEIKVLAFKYLKAAEIDGEYKRRVGQVKLQTFNDGWKNLSYLWYLKQNYKQMVETEKLKAVQIS